MSIPLGSSRIFLLTVINSLNKHAGGTTESVIGLSEGLSSLNVHNELITIVSGDIAKFRFPLPALNITHKIKGISWRNISISLFINHKIRKEAIRIPAQLIHNHGVWLPINRAASQVSRQLHLPMIYSTHGMLTSWSMNYKRIKKTIAWNLYLKKDINDCSAIHVTSLAEAEDLRRIGVKPPLALIPIGIDFPSSNLESNYFNSKKTVLFFSRIHPKKGLLNLIKAWKDLPPSDWQLVLCGPDESGHLEEIKNLINNLSLTSSISVLGPVYGDEKWRLLHSAHLFILPSLSENFGMVIPEAMAAGLPVITTTSTPWNIISNLKCGWYVDPSQQAIYKALLEATTMPMSKLKEMGEIAKMYSLNNFQWSAVGSKMIRLYQWVLGQSSAPDFII
jgi:glycosyltransferase involved in cell wall biosynthesis